MKQIDHRLKAMAFMGMLVTLYVMLICFCHNRVEGKMTISADKDLEFENQLNLLNKLPLQTIETKYGDIIDCIDIYNQPSLGHPLLKDHKIRMRPTSFPTRPDHEARFSFDEAHITTMQHNMDCPVGSVPIRRTSKEDLIRAKHFSKSFASTTHPLTGYTPGRHLAIVRSVYDPKTTYKGIEAYLSNYNPNVQANQSSASQVWIESGPPSTRNSLQFGWMVAPELFGDNNTRSFAYWSAEGGGCFNHMCSVFVQVDRNTRLGDVVDVSPYDAKTQHCIHQLIFQDRVTGDWWLTIPAYNISVGYWPRVIFPQLARGATQVTWGGHVMGQTDGPSPGMGNGRIPVHKNFRQASYVMRMKVVDQTNMLVDPAGPKYHMETFVDSPNCYSLDGYGYNGNVFGFSFLFGGPGGDDCGK